MISDRINRILEKNPGAYTTVRGVEIKRANGTVELLASIKGLQTEEKAPEKTEEKVEATPAKKAEEKVEEPAKAKPGPKPAAAKAEAKAK